LLAELLTESFGGETGVGEVLTFSFSDYSYLNLKKKKEEAFLKQC
jgi:hypothetical protein